MPDHVPDTTAQPNGVQNAIDELFNLGADGAVADVTASGIVVSITIPWERVSDLRQPPAEVAGGDEA